MKSFCKPVLTVAASLALFACGESAPATIYDEAMPDIDDIEAMETIEQRLEGDDQTTWERIKLHSVLSDRPEVESQSVGEALERERAKRECREQASGFDATIACSKTPI